MRLAGTCKSSELWGEAESGYIVAWLAGAWLPDEPLPSPLRFGILTPPHCVTSARCRPQKWKLSEPLLQGGWRLSVITHR